MKNLMFVAGVAALSLGAGGARAGVIEGEFFHWEFRVDVIGGDLAGMTFFGDLGYTIPAERGGGGLTLDFFNFGFDGVMLTEQNDLDYPSYPIALFDEKSGVFRGADFISYYERPPEVGGQIGYVTIVGDYFSYAIDIAPSRVAGVRGEDEPQGIVTYTLVPSPGAGLVLALAALAGARRRRRC